MINLSLVYSCQKWIMLDLSKENQSPTMLRLSKFINRCSPFLAEAKLLLLFHNFDNL